MLVLGKLHLPTIAMPGFPDVPSPKRRQWTGMNSRWVTVGTPPAMEGAVRVWFLCLVYYIVTLSLFTVQSCSLLLLTLHLV